MGRNGYKRAVYKVAQLEFVWCRMPTDPTERSALQAET